MTCINYCNLFICRCSKGFVQFSDGDVINANPQAIQLCAENSRFSPPVVMFADKGIATLLLRYTIGESALMTNFQASQSPRCPKALRLRFLTAFFELGRVGYCNNMLARIQHVL